MGRLTLLTLVAVWLSACDDGYDMERYEEIRSDGELSDVVHEWMHAYIEEYCRPVGKRIECE